MFADACSTSMYDDQDRSMGEAWIKKKTRRYRLYRWDAYNVVFTNTPLIMLNRGVTRYFFEQFFIHQNTRQAMPFMLLKRSISTVSSIVIAMSISRKNRTQDHFDLHALGDPESIYSQILPAALQSSLMTRAIRGFQFRYVVKDEIW